MLAVILVRMEPREENRICAEIQAMPEVVKAHLTDGTWDALLMVEGKDPADIGRFTIDKLRTVRGVEDSMVEMTQQYKGGYE